jgi:hypothetical protein
VKERQTPTSVPPKAARIPRVNPDFEVLLNLLVEMEAQLGVRFGFDGLAPTVREDEKANR